MNVCIALRDRNEQQQIFGLAKNRKAISQANITNDLYSQGNMAELNYFQARTCIESPSYGA